jgi:hypothetical protein
MTMPSKGRCRMAVLGRAALLLACLAALIWTGRAQADVRHMTSAGGVEFDAPSGWQQVPQKAPAPGTPAFIEQVLTEGAADPLRIFVLRSVTEQNKSATGMPAESGRVPQAFVDGYAVGLRGALQLAESYDHVGGRYDVTRKAFEVSLKARGASPARLLLDQPASGAAGSEVSAQGADPSLVRCLLEQLLHGSASRKPDELAAHYDSAASRCGMSLAQVQAYAAGRPALFAPTESAISCVGFFTKLGTTQIIVAGPLARARDVQGQAASIWSSAVVLPAASLPTSRLSSLLDYSEVRPAHMVGVVIGAFCGAIVFVALLAWILVKARTPPVLAVTVAMLVMLGVTIASVFGSDAPSAYDGAKLASWVFASAVFFRPLTRWADKRTQRASASS